MVVGHHLVQRDGAAEFKLASGEVESGRAQVEGGGAVRLQRSGNGKVAPQREGGSLGVHDSGNRAALLKFEGAAAGVDLAADVRSACQREAATVGVQGAVVQGEGILNRQVGGVGGQFQIRAVQVQSCQRHGSGGRKAGVVQQAQRVSTRVPSAVDGEVVGKFKGDSTRFQGSATGNTSTVWQLQASPLEVHHALRHNHEVCRGQPALGRSQHSGANRHPTLQGKLGLSSQQLFGFVVQHHGRRHRQSRQGVVERERKVGEIERTQRKRNVVCAEGGFIGQREHTGVVRNYPAEVECSLHFKSAAGEREGVSIGRKNGLCVGRQGRVRERQGLLQIQRGSGQFELGSC